MVNISWKLYVPGCMVVIHADRNGLDLCRTPYSLQ